MRDAVQIHRKIRRHTAGDGFVKIHQALIAQLIEHRGDDPNAVRANGNSVLCQLNGIGQIPGSHLNKHRHTLCRMRHHGLRHKLAFRHSQIHHFAGGSAGVQALQTVVDTVICQIF